MLQDDGLLLVERREAKFNRRDEAPKRFRGQRGLPTKIDRVLMKILLVASEITPYAKTGGLGDVVGGLSSALRERGHEVTCCLPFYRCAREAAPGAKPIGLTLSVPLGSRAVTGDVLEWTQADGVRVLFIRRDEFFDRSELYTTSVHDYEDNAERFLFFSKAVVELLGYTRFRPDVVHCHDWQTAFVPVQASYRAHTRGAEFAVKTVLTIHNIAYQGMFWSLDFPLTNLPGEFFTPDTLEFYGQMNLLKGGIVFADGITTVSPTYARGDPDPRRRVRTRHGGRDAGREPARDHQRRGLLAVESRDRSAPASTVRAGGSERQTRLPRGPAEDARDPGGCDRARGRFRVAIDRAEGRRDPGGRAGGTGRVRTDHRQFWEKGSAPTKRC